jgi:PAS domain S-box-containing protein
MFSMLADNLQDRAALYVSGEMPAPDREAFDVLLEFHGELRTHVAGLHEAMAGALMARTVPHLRPPSGLRTSILDALGVPPPRPVPEALVVTNPMGLLEWVNPAFTDMCGYTLTELRGRKPGHLLQGAGTDPAAVNRIRESLRARRACRETLVNYHKNGTSYRADVRIMPVLDDDGQPLWFVAKERLLPDAAPVGG